MSSNTDIAIPVLNEEKRLGPGVSTLVAFCRSQKIGAKIIISDNGSSDKTAEVAGDLVRSFTEVTYLRVGQKGVGRALKKAWSESTNPVVG